MKIGVLSDVHANLPALDAVLNDMPPVDAVVNVGDVIGYNPWPAECVSRIQELADWSVIGNHDRTVETPERYAANHMAEAGLQHAKRELSSDQLEWLTGRPRTVTGPDGEYLIVHCHPDATRRDTYVYPEDFPSLEEYLEEYDGVIMGHTHVQGMSEFEDGVILNPGSVGQPRDGDSRAAYAILDSDDRTVELHRVPYDIERVEEAVSACDLPRQTADRLRNGR